MVTGTKVLYLKFPEKNMSIKKCSEIEIEIHQIEIQHFRFKGLQLYKIYKYIKTKVCYNLCFSVKCLTPG